MEYDTGSGKVQNVHNKSWRNETAIEKRKNDAVIVEEELKAAKFKRTFDAVSQEQVVNVMRKDSQEWIGLLTDEEKRCIQKYTLNECEEKYKFYQRLNAMLREELTENENLRYYANVISGALKKHTLGQNIICYRGLDINPIAGVKVGEYVSLYQFTSTSIKTSSAFKKQTRIIIYAKKGSSGVAYIEEISKMPKQREVLFDKDCIYRVLSNKDNIVELEVL